jgi:dihydrolipoamide dehydrogenase
MYDLIIIGGGPAGGWASQKAKEAGLEPLLIEKRFLGGVCLNEGCIPSKTLLYSATRYHHAKDSSSFGVTASNVSYDIKKAMERKEKIIGSIRRGTEGAKKKMKIPVLFEEASILSKKNDDFQVKTASGIHEGKRLLICTGSEAIRLPIPGSDQSFVMTNREILSIDFIPQNLAIIGGGVIGLEFATFFSEIGSTVTVIEMLPAIAGSLDDDIRKILQQSLEKKGITFKLQAKVTSIGDHSVTYLTPEGKEESAPADVVLMSVGRKPSTSGIGLENIHVQIEKGAIVTDDHLRTNVPNVWAAGDINGKSMLAHTASREAEVAVADMAGKKSRVNYDTIPGVIYTHPEVASVGLTKAQADAKGVEVVEHAMPLSYNGRYLAETENERGTIKAVVDKKYGTILGVHMIGSGCSELIAAATVMIESELRVADVSDIVFPHPTVAEMVKDVIADIKL